MKNTELKKGSAELLILSLLARRPMHGYELAKLIEARSEGAVRFKAASLYPLLYRLEQRGLIVGRWLEKAGQRRRRHYRVTADGQKRLDAQHRTWAEFVAGVTRILEPDHV
jgi:transcriptional regulator